MSATGTGVTCAGCGHVVDASKALPFACPNAVEGDDVDHLLSVPGPMAEDWPADLSSRNPFVRYRRRTLAYRVARAHGLSDTIYVALVEQLDRAIAAVDGGGFRVTPLTSAPDLLDGGVDLWLKHESGNVSGSHKARHLMAVMVYLKVLEALDLPLAQGLRKRPLAIASCGNAALGAAVVARAARWPLDVFIPPDAAQAVVDRLQELEARVHVCPRVDDTPGDPCVHAFRAAVQAGSLPFGVQGNENGLAVEGGKVLGYELAEQPPGEGRGLAALFVQVGGGALGSGCMQGLREAWSSGEIATLPVFFAVQTHGAYPLADAHAAFKKLAGGLEARLQHAVTHRADFMRPWPTAPHSIAHGILDDETYDWAELVRGMAETGGEVVLATEDQLHEVQQRVQGQLEHSVCHTGTAGLAGLLAARAAGVALPDGPIVALLTGSQR